MALLDSYNLTTNQDFSNKTLIAMELAANQVAAETLTIGKEILYGKRHQLSFAILSNPKQYLYPFLLAVVSNGILTVASTDGDIQFTINSVYNNIAGVQNNEL